MEDPDTDPEWVKKAAKADAQSRNKEASQIQSKKDKADWPSYERVEGRRSLVLGPLLRYILFFVFNFTHFLILVLGRFFRIRNLDRSLENKRKGRSVHF